MGQRQSDLLSRTEHASHGIGVVKGALGRHDAAEIEKIEKSLKVKVTQVEKVSNSAELSHRELFSGRRSGGGGGGGGGYSSSSNRIRRSKGVQRLGDDGDANGCFFFLL